MLLLVYNKYLLGIKRMELNLKLTNLSQSRAIFFKVLEEEPFGNCYKL
jgi:hypothetical protein